MEVDMEVDMEVVVTVMIMTLVKEATIPTAENLILQIMQAMIQFS